MKNAHLWKRILNEGINCPELSEDRLASMQSDIVTSPIIVDSRESELGGNFNWAEYKGISIPFKHFWLEGNIRGQVPYWGALVEAVEFDSPDKWGLNVDFFSANTVHPVMFFGTILNFEIPNGSVHLDSRGVQSYAPKTRLRMTPDSIQQFQQTILSFALDALMLLSCKNVGLAARENDPKQVRRAIKRHGNQSHGYRYHVLVVRPAGAKESHPGIEIGTMPRHVCRGHFQHFGPATAHGHEDGRDRGLLFGKYAGKFFSPPSLKGKTENGIVEKDYALAGA